MGQKPKPGRERKGEAEGSVYVAGSVVEGAAVLALAAQAAQETPKDLRVAVGRGPVRRVALGVTIVRKFEMRMPIRE